ncbi:hypothetical protein [Streptomyces sp. NPDC044948]|uniref:hypothetical protein n=1 Tax=Streptomyces sp. NPDC044948 TaxID=3157092 RepID=UPI0033D14CB6
MRDESGESEVVEVGPGVGVDVELQQAGLGADAVDDVIRIGGQFAGQGAEEPGDTFDRHETPDIRTPALSRFFVGTCRDHHVRALAHGCLVVADRDAPAGAGDGQRRRVGVCAPRGFLGEDVEKLLVVGGEAGGQIAGRDEDLLPGPVLVGIVGHGSSGGIGERVAKRGPQLREEGGGIAVGSAIS